MVTCSALGTTDQADVKEANQLLLAVQTGLESHHHKHGCVSPSTLGVILSDVKDVVVVFRV